jgi:hypothetical protein
VVRWVYPVSSEIPSATSRSDTLKTETNRVGRFFSSYFPGFEASSRPQRTPTPVPASPKESINPLETNSSNIVLTIFAANVDVRLDKRMTAELLRSTLKKPPGRLRYELLYVSSAVVRHVLMFSKSSLAFSQTGKEEYDSSVKAEEEATYATESVFQGLRADLDGFVASLSVNVIIDLSNRTGSTRVFIVSVNCCSFCKATYFCRATRQVRQLVSEGIWPRGSFLL